MDSVDTLKHASNAPEQRVINLWKRLQKTALGRKLFQYLFARAVPYSASIGSQIISLEPGRVVIEMKDRKRVRNHLNSIHAIALANLGELSSGLAMIAALPPATRAIVVKLEIDYLKKARGPLIAVGSANPPESINEPMDSVANAEIKDSQGDVVSRVSVQWRLSPVTPPTVTRVTLTQPKISGE